MRNQQEAIPSGLLDVPAPAYYDSTVPNCLNTSLPNHLDTPVLDIMDESHDLLDFLLSDSDGGDVIPPKVGSNAKPCPKAVVSSQPVSHSSEELSSGEDDEDLKGGLFSVREVEKIRAEYAAFDKWIVILAREMGRSVNSIQKIGGWVS